MKKALEGPPHLPLGTLASLPLLFLFFEERVGEPGHLGHHVDSGCI